MQVIFSCEDKTYMWWQAELLRYTFEQARMSGELTAIVAATDEPRNAFTCNVFHASNYKDHCANGSLLCLNKPGGILEWASLESSSDETVLIVDPDSIFLRPIIDPGPIPAGEAYSEEHEYMRVEYPANKQVIDRHCKRAFRAAIQPVGIYVFVNRSCLVELSRLWLQKSIEIASDPICREALAGTGWLSDMWGYAIAAAELGIRHHVRGFSQVTGANSLEQPITHYCFPLLVEPTQRWAPDTQTPILWSKWSYLPWSDPPNPDASIGEGRILLQVLWELVNMKRVQFGQRRSQLDPRASARPREVLDVQ